MVSSIIKRSLENDMKYNNEILLSARKYLKQQQSRNKELFHKEFVSYIYSNNKSGMWSAENKFEFWQLSQSATLEDAIHQAQEGGEELFSEALV